MYKNDYIETIILDEGSIIRRSNEIEHERNTAISDIISSNPFQLINHNNGPYLLNMSLSDNRLIMIITSENMARGNKVIIPITPFRRIVKDYFMICESYFEAVKANNPYKIEAIDMGRRGIHNEGSELLIELLAKNIKIDFDTARRLFTLICVLHLK